MSRPFAPLPAALGATFTAAEARAAGVGSRRLHAPDVERVLRGVYRRVGAGHDFASTKHSAERWRLDQVSRACALAPALGPEQYFSHRTAAALLGLPVPMPADRSDALDVAAMPPARVSRRNGIRGHHLRAGLADVQTVNGIRVASAASVWAMLAGHLTLTDLVALGDAVIHRARIPGTQRLTHAPLAAPEELGAHVARGQRHGIAALRRALPLLSTASASAPESHLRLMVAEWGFPQPALDYDVYDHRGTLLGASEIAFPEYRVALEYEGDHHRIEQRQWNRDIAKYEAYARAGWHPVRVTASLLYRPHSPLRSNIATTLSQRGWLPSL